MKSDASDVLPVCKWESVRFVFNQVKNCHPIADRGEQTSAIVSVDEVTFAIYRPKEV